MRMRFGAHPCVMHAASHMLRHCVGLRSTAHKGQAHAAHARAPTQARQYTEHRHVVTAAAEVAPIGALLGAGVGALSGLGIIGAS